MVKLLNRITIEHMLEDGAPSTVDRDIRMDLVVLAGKLEEATMSTDRHKGFLIDNAYVEPQAATHLQHKSATIDSIAAANSEVRKSAHYARPERVL